MIHLDVEIADKEIEYQSERIKNVISENIDFQKAMAKKTIRDYRLMTRPVLV